MALASAEETRALDLLKKADAALKRFSLFSSSAKYEDAVDCYLKAANNFKLVLSLVLVMFSVATALDSSHRFLVACFYADLWRRLIYHGCLSFARTNAASGLACESTRLLSPAALLRWLTSLCTALKQDGEEMAGGWRRVQQVCGVRDQAEEHSRGRDTLRARGRHVQTSRSSGGHLALSARHHYASAPKRWFAVRLHRALAASISSAAKIAGGGRLAASGDASPRPRSSSAAPMLLSGPDASRSFPRRASS